MKNLKLEFTLSPSLKEVATLEQGIAENTREKIGLESPQSFGFFHRDQERILAGCNGILLYGMLYLDQLWVDKSLRGQGIGRELIERVEAFAKESHCFLVSLNTMSWEARGFYESLGYKVYATLDGLQKGSQMFSLKKELSSQ